MFNFDFESYLIEAINGFDNDPADTPYQEGYEAALREMMNAFNAATPIVQVTVHG